MTASTTIKSLRKAIDAIQSDIEILIDGQPENNGLLLKISNAIGNMDCIVADTLERQQRLENTSSFLNEMWALNEVEETLDDMFLTWANEKSDTQVIMDGHSLSRHTIMLYRLMFGK